jgi:hypothetical protein
MSATTKKTKARVNKSALARSTGKVAEARTGIAPASRQLAAEPAELTDLFAQIDRNLELANQHLARA